MSSKPAKTLEEKYFALIAFCVLAPFAFAFIFVSLRPMPLRIVLPDIGPKAKPVIVTSTEALALAATSDIPAQTKIDRSMLVFVWVKGGEHYKNLVINYDEAVGLKAASNIAKGTVLRKYQVERQALKVAPD